jgi:hypothetical protein
LLLPNETAAIPIQVTLAPKLRVALNRQTHPFTITTRMLAGEHLPRSVLGQLIQKPLIGPGIMAVLATILIICAAFILKPLVEGAVVDPPFSLLKRERAAESNPVLLPRPAKPETPALPADTTLSSQNKKKMTYEQMFQEIGARYQVDWRVLEAMAYRESRMNYLAIGVASDMGLMQIIPTTWNEWAPKLNVYDPFDPYSNIMVGAAYLAHVREFCMARGRSEPHWMLVGYNWGPDRLSRFLDGGGTWDQVPPAQRKYASGILELAANRALNASIADEIYSNEALE